VFISVTAWVSDKLKSNNKIVVIEIGAGFNTPTVTRFPAESIISEAGINGAFVRLNPGDGPEGMAPFGDRSICFREGWEKLNDIVDVREEGGRGGWEVMRVNAGEECIRGFRQHIGHFDWRVFIEQLKD